eukprot:1187667-Prorocentrum_minimum.AAC.10
MDKNLKISFLTGSMDDDALAADSVLIEAGVKPRKWVQNARERAKAVKAFGIGSERFKDSDVRAHNMITVYEPVQPYEKITSIVTSQLILTKYVSLCQNEPVILPWSSAKGASAIHAAYGAYPMYPGERSAQSQYPAQIPRQGSKPVLSVHMDWHPESGAITLIRPPCKEPQVLCEARPKEQPKTIAMAGPGECFPFERPSARITLSAQRTSPSCRGTNSVLGCIPVQVWDHAGPERDAPDARPGAVRTSGEKNQSTTLQLSN